MLKIYFAGSIRGGRVDAGLYHRMIDYLNQRGRVLTEHVGNLALSALEQGRQRDADIYNQDTAWLRQCDILIAECTCPSLGVGYELAYAEQLGKPCYLFYRKDRVQLSAMLTGDPYFRIYPYLEEEEIYTALDLILEANEKSKEENE